MIPYIGAKRNSVVNDNDMVDESSGDMENNNLIYKQPMALSLAKTRTQVKQFFQRSDYSSAPNKTAIIDLNTGSSYIDVYNSFLSFDVTAWSTAQEEFSFGDGSAMNVIDRITIRTRSGTEVERLEGANL